jgi:dihydrofolate synthase/folylpolyglutamate synthase
MPTFFEYLFLMAVCYFQEENVEVAVMEVGLGGRLDATSAVTPLACIITRIARDHEGWLGDKISSIAREKAGIIKPGVPVFSYQGPSSPAGRILSMQARACHSPFHALPGNRLHRISGSRGTYVFRGRQVYRFSLVNDAFHLARNAVCALMTVEWLVENHGYVISPDIIGQAVSAVELPGRIQFWRISCDQEIILDIAHNPDGFAALARVLKARKYQDLVLLFGVLKDKKFRKMLDKILRFVKMIIITEPESHRFCDGRVIGNYLEGRKKWLYRKDIKKALMAAREEGRSVLVAGSFYLVGPVMGILSQEVQCEKRNV